METRRAVEGSEFLWVSRRPKGPSFHFPICRWFARQARLIIDHVSEQEYPIFHPVQLGYVVPLGVGAFLWATGGAWNNVLRAVVMLIYSAYTLSLPNFIFLWGDIFVVG